MAWTTRVFRAPTWIKGLNALGVVFFTLSAIVLLGEQEGVWWTTSGSLALMVLSWLGLLDTFTTRVVLGEETLEIVSNFSKKTFDRSALIRVQGEIGVRGVSVALARRAGGWILRPAWLERSRVNTLRAWLRHR